MSLVVPLQHLSWHPHGVTLLLESEDRWPECGTASMTPRSHFAVQSGFLRTICARTWRPERPSLN